MLGSAITASSALASALADCLLRCVGFRWLLGARAAVAGRLCEHEQVLAAIDAGQRRACDAREHLARSRDRASRTCARPRDPADTCRRGPDVTRTIADLDVRGGRHEAELGRRARAGAVEHRAHAAALDLDRHRVVLVGDERDLGHVREHARDLADDAVRIDDRLARRAAQRRRPCRRRASARTDRGSCRARRRRSRLPHIATARSISARSRAFSCSRSR